MMIIQVEYPKSGGTWVYKMVSYYLNIPVFSLLECKHGNPVAGEISDPEMARREGCDGKNPFPGQKEFGFISQTHELPNNRLFRPENCSYYLVRDGRDVIVSYFFYESRYQVKKSQTVSKLSLMMDILNHYATLFWPERRRYSRIVDLSKEKGLSDKYVAMRAREWRYHVESWLRTRKPYFRYEDFLNDTQLELYRVLNHIDAEIDPDLLEETVRLMSFENCRKLENGLDEDRRFYRKGIHGDWMNHFTCEHREIFKKIAGPTLIDLGYEKGLDW